MFDHVLVRTGLTAKTISMEHHAARRSARNRSSLPTFDIASGVLKGRNRTVFDGVRLAA
jgi:hypothetical protein